MRVLFVGLWLLYIGIKMLKRVTFYKLDAYLLSNIFVIYDFVYSSKQVDCGDTFNIDYWFVAFQCLSIVNLSFIKSFKCGDPASEMELQAVPLVIIPLHIFGIGICLQYFHFVWNCFVFWSLFLCLLLEKCKYSIKTKKTFYIYIKIEWASKLRMILRAANFSNELYFLQFYCE